jgi:hypothetical protein
MPDAMCKIRRSCARASWVSPVTRAFEAILEIGFWDSNLPGYLLLPVAFELFDTCSNQVIDTIEAPNSDIGIFYLLVDCSDGFC